MQPPYSSSSPKLNRQDFLLFRQEVAREIEKILPVNSQPVIWSAQEQESQPGAETVVPAEILSQLQDLCSADAPGRLQEMLVLPFTVAEGEQVAVILRGIDPGLSQKMATEWLAEIRDQLRASLEQIKQAYIHPETGLYSSRLLHRQLVIPPAAPASFFLVGATHRTGPAGAGLLQLAQTARLLEAGTTGSVYYLGGNLFAVLQDQMGREAALHFARRLLGRLKREGLRSVHIGMAVRGEAGVEGASGPWFDEGWQALETAERRGPFSLCEAAALRRQLPHPLARPSSEVIRKLRRGWRSQGRFGLLLFRRETEEGAGSLLSLLAPSLAGSQLPAPVSADEVYVLLPGASAQDSLRQGRSLKKKMEGRAGGGRVALGISFWPCLHFSRTETTTNCRKALLHGRFLGPGAITMFDHVSLNVSGDLCFDEGDYRQAIRDYRAGLRLNPEDINLMNSLGVTLAELNRQHKAVSTFDRVLAADPDNFMALVNKGFALRMLGRHEEALACFEQVARQPGFETSAAFADISLQLGRLYCAAGRYPEALAVLAALVQGKNERQGFHLHRLLGEAYAGTGDNAKAIRSLQKAIRYNPHDAQSLSILGKLYALEEQGDEIAHSLCLQAVALDDKPAGYWYRLAWVRNKMGKREEALAAIRESLRRNREDRDSLLLAGQIFMKLGYGKQAMRIYRRVEKAAPVESGAADPSGGTAEGNTEGRAARQKRKERF